MELASRLSLRAQNHPFPVTPLLLNLSDELALASHRRKELPDTKWLQRPAALRWEQNLLKVFQEP